MINYLSETYYKHLCIELDVIFKCYFLTEQKKRQYQRNFETIIFATDDL